MASIVFGLIFMILGVWGVVENWYAFLDFVCVFIPAILVLGGIVALAAGIKKLAVDR